ncbi:hypothetical protein [Kordiimonas gwangyangensis]|uniref:hypothetical protein n=1 Tax=Kordiimonas gwangyangensis TaxID=288022 RepID=UPI00037ED0E2|nr:hypothetical protein [Kordiimonas gwangyangensis]
MTGIDGMPQSTPVPDWVAAGAWKPRGYGLLVLVRRNILTLCFLVSYFSAQWHGWNTPVWDLFVAIGLDYVQRQLSWSLQTNPVDVYKSSVSSVNTHLPRNDLERWRMRRPIVAHGCILLLLFGPWLLLDYYYPLLPVMAASYYMAYLLLIIAPFSGVFRNFEKHTEPDFPPGMKLPEVLRRHGKRDISRVQISVYLWLLLALPLIIFFWFVVASWPGRPGAQIGASYLTACVVLAADQAIYQCKVYFISTFHSEDEAVGTEQEG